MLGLVCYILYYSDPNCSTLTERVSVVSQFSTRQVTHDSVFPTKCSNGGVNIYANFDPASTSQLLVNNNVTLNYIFYNGSYIHTTSSRGCTEINDTSLYKPYNVTSQNGQFWYEIVEFENPCTSDPTHQDHKNESYGYAIFLFVIFFFFFMFFVSTYLIYQGSDYRLLGGDSNSQF